MVLLIMMFKMNVTFQSLDKLINVIFKKNVTERYFELCFITVDDRLSAAALISFSPLKMPRLF